MSAAAWFHLRSRRIVVIDNAGLVWRVVSDGATEEREPTPVFEIKPIGPGVIELGFMRRKRRLRLVVASDTPSPPEWKELRADQVASMVLGIMPKKSGALDLIKKAGRAALEIGAVMRQVNQALAYMQHK